VAFQLFPNDQVVGIFRGFQQGGLEFHADLVLPYRNDFQNTPMHGQFILVQLETPDEAVLGRIASFSSDGKLAYGSGEEFNIRAVRENRAVPEDLREQYLKYRVNIRVLGVLRANGKTITFVPSHRRLPHVGSKVAFPAPDVIREIAGHNVDGSVIGHLAFGEYIYAEGSPNIETQNWMQIVSPEVNVRFPIDSLVSRRSFIFARAGFGKSNLNKLLFSKLYEQTPTVEKRRGKKVPVGTVLFDPDGEYFWPDDKGRPGLCDVPALEDKVVVFTGRKSRSPFYQSFVAGGIKLDIRRLRPADVIAIALDPERQEQQNVRKLRGLSQHRWESLVNAVDVNGHATPLKDVADLLDLELPRQEAEASAARANITVIVRMLHDKSSQMMDKLMRSLSEGKLCIIDVSQMRGGQSLILSGIILRRIFDRNQEQFTEADPKTIPTIAVVEEAQSVLNDKEGASEPYIAWIKEGRKYDLGALLITQQPGSIPVEILSQGDNWFVFHLLSASDLTSLKRANSHFSDDLLSSLLNEPIPGQGVFWSSVGGKPYPISLRAQSFENTYNPRDPDYNQPTGKTFAQQLPDLLGTFDLPEEQQAGVVLQAPGATASTESGLEAPGSDQVGPGGEEQLDELAEPVDVMGIIEKRAIESLKSDSEQMARLGSEDGVAWGSLKAFFVSVLPEHLDDRDRVAFQLVIKAMNDIFGPQYTAWESYKNDDRKTTYVRLRK
jgi:hypothetical protein